MPAMRKRGFTLIELLVVIAIIAILAAILFPVFAKARENARKSTCSSNMKQITAAFMQYTQDHDEFYPANFTRDATRSHSEWMVLLDPYIKNTQVFSCPSAPMLSSTSTIRGIKVPNRALGMNESIAQSTDAADVPQKPVSQTQIGRPADLLLVSDCLYAINGNDARRIQAANFSASNVWDYLSQPASLFTDPSMARHAGGVNVGFCDGHVKWYAQSAVANLPLRYTDARVQ